MPKPKLSSDEAEQIANMDMHDVERAALSCGESPEKAVAYWLMVLAYVYDVDVSVSAAMVDDDSVVHFDFSVS